MHLWERINNISCIFCFLWILINVFTTIEQHCNSLTLFAVHKLQVDVHAYRILFNRILCAINAKRPLFIKDHVFDKENYVNLKGWDDALSKIQFSVIFSIYLESIDAITSYRILFFILCKTQFFVLMSS